MRTNLRQPIQFQLSVLWNFRGNFKPQIGCHQRLPKVSHKDLVIVESHASQQLQLGFRRETCADDPVDLITLVTITLVS